MSSKRRRFSGGQKAKIGLEELRGDRTVQEIASRHQVQPGYRTPAQRRRHGERSFGATFPVSFPAGAWHQEATIFSSQTWFLVLVGARVRRQSVL